MNDPIVITAPAGETGRFQTALSLNADQVGIVTAAVASALQLPESKSACDLVLFSLAIHPQGGGRLVVTVK